MGSVAAAAGLSVEQTPTSEQSQSSFLKAMSSWVLSASNDGEVTASPGSLCSVWPLSQDREKKYILWLNGISCTPICAHRLLSSHWIALSRVGLHLLYPLPPYHFCTLMSSILSCLFLRLYSPSSQFLLVWQTVHSLHHLLALVSLQ